MHGLLVVNKPAGITSRKVVDRVEAWFPGVRVGHAGTLDPLATGVLVLCLGQATRLIEYVQRMRKTYRTGLRLGATSDSDDADGTITPLPDPPQPTPEQLETVLGESLGEIEQVPPAHSAAKVAGRRAYWSARKGRGVELPPRRVRIDRIDVLRYRFPTLELEIECGKGTYIRSIARDLGRRLGCGAYVETLIRTRIGPFQVSEALALNADAGQARGHVLPLRAAVTDLPSAVLPEESIQRLRHGQAVPLPVHLSGSDSDSVETAILNDRDELVAIARRQSKDGVLLPEKNL